MKMESNDKLKEIDIKNSKWYYFDDIIIIENFDLDNILIREKSYGKIYNISYKNLIAVKPLRIRFDETDGFIRVYDGTRYLVLFGSKKYDSIYNRIINLLGVKDVLHVYFLIIMKKSNSYYIYIFSSL